MKEEGLACKLTICLCGIIAGMIGLGHPASADPTVDTIARVSYPDDGAEFSRGGAATVSVPGFAEFGFIADGFTPNGSTNLFVATASFYMPISSWNPAPINPAVSFNAEGHWEGYSNHALIDALGPGTYYAYAGSGFAFGPNSNPTSQAGDVHQFIVC